MKKAIIIGASSGIGRSLAETMAQEGYELGLTGRRMEMLLDLQKNLKTKSYIKQMDVTRSTEAMDALESLIQEMQGVDLIVLNAGILFNNPDLEWEKEKKTIEVNVLGFAALANSAMKYFIKKGEGHIVGISSISAIRGESDTPAYNASKAFVSNYLEGLRTKGFKEARKIHVTDIQPGWVDTDMAKGYETFWMATKDKAARQIFSAIKKKRRQAYITRRWGLYALVLRLTPRWLYDRLF